MLLPSKVFRHGKVSYSFLCCSDLQNSVNRIAGKSYLYESFSNQCVFKLKFLKSEFYQSVRTFKPTKQCRQIYMLTVVRLKNN